MEQLFKNNYVEIVVDASQSVLQDRWNTATERMQINEFKEILGIWMNLMIKYKIQYALINTAQFKFLIPPDLQQWIDNQILSPTFQTGYLKKRAIVVSSDIFAEVSVEQVMEEEGGANLPTRFFREEEEAYQWLIS